MSMGGRIYVATMSAVAQTAAKTLIQIAAASGNPLELLRCTITQDNGDASEQTRALIRRKSAAATVTSFTPILLDPDGIAAKAVGGTALTGTNASAEGTPTDIIVDEGFNILSGFIWVPTPEERIRVNGGGFIGLELAATIVAADISAQMFFREF